MLRLFVIALCFCVPSSAQKPKTIGDLIGNLFEVLKQQKQVEVQDSEQTKLKEQKTGENSFANQLEGSIKNFLPLFSGILEGYETTNDGESLTLNFNIPKFLKEYGTFQIQAQIRKPTLSQAIVSQIPEEGRADVLKTLEDSFQDFDSNAYSLSFNLEHGVLGRKFNDNRIRALDRLTNASIQRTMALLQKQPNPPTGGEATAFAQKISWDNLDQTIKSNQREEWLKNSFIDPGFVEGITIQAIQDFHDVLPREIDKIWSPPQSIGNGQFREFIPKDLTELEAILNSLASMLNGRDLSEFRKEVSQLFLDRQKKTNIWKNNPLLIELKFLGEDQLKHIKQAAANFFNVEKKLLDIINSGIKAHKIDDFSMLINNQPQLHFSLTRNDRSALVGQNGWEFKGTFELGVKNFRRWLKHDENGRFKKYILQSETATPAGNEALLSSYLNYLENVNKGLRFSCQIEYEDIESRNVFSEALPEILFFEADSKFKGTLSVGQYLTVIDGVGQDRWDFSAAYETYKKGANKRDRFLTSLTYTPKPGKLVTFPISLVYANHGEFLEEIDDEISAHFGISFKSN